MNEYYFLQLVKKNQQHNYFFNRLVYYNKRGYIYWPYIKLFFLHFTRLIYCV